MPPAGRTLLGATADQRSWSGPSRRLGLLDCPHTKLSGETLARRFRSPRAVLRAWLASAAHREVLLDGRYDRIGVAVIRESGGLLVVADFIAP